MAKDLRQETGVVIGADIGAGTEAGTIAGKGAGKERDSKKGEDLGQRHKGDTTRAQSFASHSFLLAVYYCFFFTTSFLESVTA